MGGILRRLKVIWESNEGCRSGRGTQNMLKPCHSKHKKDASRWPYSQCREQRSGWLTM
jgi:hypothetical protein